ncbi:MAG: hypothetical protein HXS48_05000 [Theionarchaea archaeon]|nr:MAG: hypothetical protein AYK19_15015 [Theionarchaea archaeon DG-70-1]MBU7026278.1 hypothetical protein [Theionarchaea archaeon]
MDKKQRILVALIGASIAFLAITAVTANSRASNTPLYTYRMEQQSSEMNFLPTERNTFTYETEGRCVLNSCGCGDGAKPLNPYTCGTCDEYYCDNPSLCYGTCHSTCSTCSGNTCFFLTCQYPTCFWPTCNYC